MRAAALALLLAAAPAMAEEPKAPTIYHLPADTLFGFPDGSVVQVPAGWFVPEPALVAYEERVKTLSKSLLEARNASDSMRWVFAGIGLAVGIVAGGLAVYFGTR